MSYSIRHSVKDVALADLLELVNCFLPSAALPSLYLFLKNFVIADFVEHYFCRKCESLISFENNSVATCSKCKTEFSKSTLKRNGDYFVQIPLKAQLAQLLSTPLFHELDRDGPQNDALCDITSGSVHKKIRRNNIMTGFDIDIQTNFDGVKLYKSSKMSLCPSQVMINNLSYKLRKQNILLTGLWASRTKPIMDLYLKPIIDELKDLHENGFQCTPPGFEEPITIKVHTILAPVDSVERCVLQNIHQFNGEFGCSYCLHPGENIKLSEKSYLRVYKGDVYEKRTKTQHINDAIAAAESNGEVFNGVTGISPFLFLPIFHIINGFPPDYLHCVLLGVVNLFLSEWLEPSFIFSISNKFRLLNARLANIKPPFEISRIAQPVENLCRWKGSELRSFLLYYSLPCLQGILDIKLYKHWSLLVFAITIFNSDEISDSDFYEASIALRTFVLEAEALYGEKIMKFNVHLLLHIPKFVKMYGPLWAWSAFPYEGYNSVLRSMVHSSQTVLNQICKNYLRFQKIKYDETFDGPCNENAKQFFDKMLGKYKKHTGKRLMATDHLFVYGRGKPVTMSLTEKLEIERLLNEEISSTATCYERFVYNRTLYHSNTYSRMIRRKNSVVETESETFIDVNGLYRVCTKEGKIYKNVVIGKLFNRLENENLCAHRGIQTSKFCIPVTQTDNVTAVFPRSLQTKAIFIPSNDCYSSYVVRLVNKVETD